MLRRCFHPSSTTLPQHQLLSLTTSTASVRGMRTADQYYPIHTFDAAAASSAAASAGDMTLSEFKTMVTNPGPLRVVFSEDYLDWYFRAFKEKLSFERTKQTMMKKGMVSSSSSVDDAALTLSQQQKRLVKPPHSPLRQLGESVMSRSQQRIDSASIQHGLLDLFERCPQFPQVHIDRAKDEHIPLLFEEFIFRSEINAADVWRRALIARAMLLANKKSYPSSFDYMFKEHLPSCVFSKPLGLKNSSNSASGSNNGSSAGATQSDTNNIAAELLDDAAIKKYPTLALAKYYEFLVKKYRIQNAVEAHVLLKCHLAPDADRLLFSNPPPEEERDPSKIGGGPDWEEALAMPLPPIEALFEEKGNLPLARALLFAEFNCHVSHESDVFQKFPQAQSAVTRPSQPELREEAEKQSLISKFQHRRHHVLPTIVQYTIAAIDMRARDANRLARQQEMSDMNWASSTNTLQKEGSEKGDASIGAANFNHRAVRAELRDFVNRRLISGLKQYRNGRQLVERPTLLQTEEFTRFRTDGQGAPGVSMMNVTRVPFLKVSMPRFVAMIESDPHVHAILSLLASSSTANKKTMMSGSRSSAEGQLRARVQRLVYDHAKQLLRLALEYRENKTRGVQLKATKISAALLDGAVVDALDYLRNVERERLLVEHDSCKHQQADENDNEGAKKSGNSSSSASAALSTSILRSGSSNAVLASEYVPFADRALNEFGFPTEAKFDDFARWTRTDTVEGGK